MALVAQTRFYDNFNLIHGIPEVEEKDAEIGIFLYNHTHNQEQNGYNLSLERTVYFRFDELLKRFSSIQAGRVEDFVAVLEKKTRSKVLRSSKVE